MTLRLLGPGLTTEISSSGLSVLVNNGSIGLLGGVITNPLSPVDQGLQVGESLWVNLLGPAVLSASNGSVELTPGQSFLVPPGARIWANAYSAKHKFSAYFYSGYAVPYPPEPVTGVPGAAFGGPPFPPVGVTGLTTVIPSYLYQEYSDDDDLQGFVAAQNDMQQNFVDTFNALNLPIYPGPIVAGKLLDWVGQGLYGMARPALSSGLPVIMGPLNTYGPNWIFPMWDPVPPSTAITFGLNEIEMLSIGDVVITDDDIYRRILTWHFYKGDGNYFSVRFLKRRIWRFLFGANGTAPELVPPGIGDESIADTEQISVTLGVNRNITIRFVLGKRTTTGGAMPNDFGCNGFGINRSAPLASFYPEVQLNDLETIYVAYPPLPFMPTFKEALDAGILEVPYQFDFTCHIG
jgi:hypothetical protein